MTCHQVKNLSNRLLEHLMRKKKNEETRRKNTHLTTITSRMKPAAQLKGFAG